MDSRRQEEYLPLSALQHYAFCPRQFALIHLEQQWAENLRTMDGQIFHRRAHDAALTEKRGPLLVSRGLAVYEPELGVRGVCDVVEFRRDEAGVPLFGREGQWSPMPVEYKRGRPRVGDEADAIQLCAQALCLEYMLGCEIPRACLYYGEPARRLEVALDEALRQRVRTLAGEMHACYARGHTPRPRPAARCRACSLGELCLPRLNRAPDPAAYLAARLGEEEGL